MAFDKTKIVKLSNVMAADSVSPSLQRFFYRTTADAKAAIVAAGYFNAHRKYLQVGDLVQCWGTDGMFFANITAVPPTGNVTSAAVAMA